MRHHIRAALFDLDGVVVFTDRYHYQAWKRLADERGWAFDPQVNHRLRGVPRMASLEIILEHNGITLDAAEKERLAELKNRYYVESLRNINAEDLYPGVLDLLDRLRAEGVKLALCSSSRNAPLVLERLGLGPRFDTVVSGADIRRAKPDPEIFLLAAQRLRVPPFHCVVFEDAESGVQAARAAGMKCIGVGEAERLPSADECVTDYGAIDVPALLDTGRCRPLRVEPWAIVEETPQPRRAGYWGTIFALSNGYLGVRGSREEDTPDALSHPATFINGFVGYEPYHHIWEFPGFAKRLHAVLNACDWTGVEIEVDGVRLGRDLAPETDRRMLDLRRGVLERTASWRAPRGALIEIRSRRLASMARRHCAAMRYEIRADRPVTLRVAGVIRVDMPSAALPGRQVELGRVEPTESGWTAELIARTGTDRVVASFRAHLAEEATVLPAKTSRNADRLEQHWTIRAEAGRVYALEKTAVFHSTLEASAEEAWRRAAAEAREVEQLGFDKLLAEQAAFWQQYWERADIRIEGAEADQQAVRFSLFHLRQSHPEDSLRSISANGQTGDKYCGHVFWDTEMYMAPHFLYTEPETVRSLLLYRYRLLDAARERARQLDGVGACYSWNSITGEECGVVFEASTAEYHLNNAIAWAIHRYVEATGDKDFLLEYGAEMLFETAKFLYDLGGFVPLKGGEFRLNAVCGPDEYGCGINNNCYFNAMTQWHFEYAAAVFDRLRREAPEHARRLREKTGVTERDVADWRRAAERMFIPYNRELGIHEENDTFLGLEPVDMDLIPRNTDLREMMHPLNLWRLRVVKQADVVLLMFVLGHRFSADDKRRNYEFYEPITCHGSSLSAGIHAVIAAEIGRMDDAYDYFRQSARMDLNDFKNNTSGGIHSACLGATWMAVVNGMAGMRDYPDGLHFNPRLPAAWKSYAFKIVYRGRQIAVSVDADGATFQMTAGTDCPITVFGRTHRLRPGHPLRV